MAVLFPGSGPLRSNFNRSEELLQEPLRFDSVLIRECHWPLLNECAGKGNASWGQRYLLTRRAPTVVAVSPRGSLTRGDLPAATWLAGTA